MTTAKKPTVAALQRKIERLEAQIEAMREMDRRTGAVYSSMLGDITDHRVRAQQAIRILSGEDECQ